MNPLTLRGPEFLAFYLLYGVGILGACWLVRAVLRSAGQTMPAITRWTPGVYPREGDAYTIALLRGGPKEVARTVLGRLFSTGQIRLDGTDLRRGTPEAAAPLASIESAVLMEVMAGVAATQAESRALTAVEPHLGPMKEDLQQQGLVPSPVETRSFSRLRMVALVLVLGFGLAKLLKAMSEGRTNTDYLVLMLFAYGFGTVVLLRPPERTPAGDRYLGWLKESHQGLVNLITNGRRESHGEMLLVAGIYGLQVLPVLSPLSTALQPPSSSASGCGSDGGGCGGGGCGGGGCGGCGG